MKYLIIFNGATRARWGTGADDERMVEVDLTPADEVLIRSGDWRPDELGGVPVQEVKYIIQTGDKPVIYDLVDSMGQEPITFNEHGLYVPPVNPEDLEDGSEVESDDAQHQ